ncbi:protein FAR1-RELATED SEQUENCE 5-like [Canna indica]|uniref:Protein FAR1-RELATED SEQUENCE 5-like n=1 Tax=Canna indica TaxID=4628 RepID=A0AAQ3KB41_9LILI|nr:protein FAR1-RELATED SEQUENCE 5-like [Canna indica]
MDEPLESVKAMDNTVGSSKTLDRSLEGTVVVDVSGEGSNKSTRKTSTTNGSIENENDLSGATEIANIIDGSGGNLVTDTYGRSTIDSDGSVKHTANADGFGEISPEVTDQQLEPKVGMVFQSEEQAYNFYNLYAKRKGFSVRKGHLSRRRDNSIRDRHYVCSNEGTRQEHRTHVTKKPRPLERTKCLARIEFKVNRSDIWVINKFIEEHNHLLASPNKIHMLRSHRKKLPIERAIFTEADYYYGVKPSEMHGSHSEELCGMEDDELHMKNQTSCLSTTRLRDLEKGDAQFLLDFLKNKQSEDPSFFYAVQIDEKERLTNFFWADARSVNDFAYFGDAVLFDTTHRTSRFDIPFAAFIGINHHKQIVIFGAALLLDESVESFIWLFRAFMAAMSGRQPKTIFTDRCAEMSKAVNMTFPYTCHRFCLWHILQNVPKNFHGVSNREPNFQKDFEDCIFGGNTEEIFCKLWDNLISKHGLGGNAWLKDLHAVREKWALAYLNNSFCATMTTKQWAESMDNLFKIHFYRKLPIPKFMVQYFKALVQLREKELLEDYESRQTKPVLLVDIPVLAEAAESYTRTIYMDFEYEYKSQLACLCEPIAMDGTIYTFRVSVPQKCTGIVEFNPSNITIKCSCKKFESMGILCMHILKVLNNNNILYLPPQYILKRWMKSAKDGTVYSGSQLAVDSNAQESLTSRYSRICHKAVSIAVKCALSKDALEILEHGLDRFFITEMRNIFNGGPWTKQTQDMNVIDDVQQNTLETSGICFEGFEFAAR